MEDIRNEVTGSYDASQIQVLEGLEAVRRRPGMYNSVDEALAGFCTHIEVFLHEGNGVTVRDNGRGIPVGYHEKTGKDALEVALTILHAGGKFGGGGYKVSGGLHGVGLSCVNALSEKLRVEVRREGKLHVQDYSRGIPLDSVHVEPGEVSETGTTVHFWPDPDIFDTLEFSYDTLRLRLRELAFLNAGLRITFTDERVEPHRVESYCYVGGIREFVTFLNKNKELLQPEPLYFSGVRMEGDMETASVEVAMQYNDGYNELILTYANNIATHEGGSHLVGFKAALTRVVNDYARKFNFLKATDQPLSGDDIREGLTAIISVKLEEPQFEGQTKTKLGNADIRPLVPGPGQAHHREVHHRLPGSGRGPQGPGADEAQERSRLCRPARQAGRLPGEGPQQVRDLHRRGRLRRRLRQDGPRQDHPGHPAPARQDPERGEGPDGSDAGEQRDPGHDHRFRRRHGLRLRRNQAPLPQDHLHDRCGRGRQPYPAPAPHLLLPAHAAPH